MKIEWKKFFTRLYEKALFEEDILNTAAQVGFYFMFALFPLLLFLISLFGIILESAQDFRAEMFVYLRQIMPGSAYELVRSTIKEVTESSTGGKLTIGLLIALWSASAGVDSLRIALNSVYNLEEKRTWLKTKSIALAVTFALALLVTLALAFVFYGWKLLSYVFGYFNVEISQFFLIPLQWATILAVLLVIFAIIYNFLPRQSPFKWKWITPGAVTGIVLWLLLSYSFKLYLSYFNSYDKTYGSLGAVIILMLWLYLTALVILIGGIINSTLSELTDPEAAKKAEEKSADKLERAKAGMPAHEVEKMIEEKTGQQEKNGQQEKSRESEKDEKPVAEKQGIPALTGGAQPATEVYSLAKNEPEIKDTSKKTVVGLTVAGVFGFLMGMIMKNKD